MANKIDKTKAKKTTTKKTNTNKKSTATKANAEKSIQKSKFGDTILDEVVLILLIVFSFILLIALFTEKMGIVGLGLSRVLKGLLGIGGFFLPIIVIFFCIYLLSNKPKKFLGIKIFGGIMFCISIGMLFSTIFDNPAMSEKTFENIKRFYLNGSGLNGGLIGGYISYGIENAFNGPVSAILALTIIIISIILATGRSFFLFIGKFFTFIGSKKEKLNEYKDERLDEYFSDEDEEFDINRSDKFICSPSELAEKYKMNEKRKMHDIVIDDSIYKNKSSSEESKNLREKIHSEPNNQDDLIDFKELKSVKVSTETNNKKPFDFIEEIKKERENVYSSHIELNPDLSDCEKSYILDLTKDTSDDSYYEDLINEFGNNDYLANEYEKEAEGVLNNKINSEKGEEVSEEDTQDIYMKKEEETSNDASDDEIKKDCYENSIINKNIENIAEKMNESGFVNKFSENEEDGPSENAIIGKKAGELLKPNNNETNVVQSSSMIKPSDEKYIVPPIDILGKKEFVSNSDSKSEMISNAKKLEITLKSFGVDAKVIQINKGPTVTRYELSPSQGVKVSKIVNLADDLALNLAANGIRIEAPIPGKAAVGIEVPNSERRAVYLREVLETDKFKEFPSNLAFAVGQDISGSPVVTDLAKMPHLLIAGATGAGKSVCINTLIVSLLYKSNPNHVKLLLVDPKVVELSIYNGIPHLLIPVVTDPKKAAGALNWAVREMELRYADFAAYNVRDIKGYNEMKKESGDNNVMPQIVIVIDELADLMMTAPGEVEESICRLTQKARAAGIHLIIATQRPSVDVITGLIKANIPSRLAFAVSSGIDSRTILDTTGAEKLLGKGDMLFCPVGLNKPVRIQGAFVTDKEVENIVSFIKQHRNTQYDEEMIEKITSSSAKTADGDEGTDEFFRDALKLIIKKQKASVSMLQRQFRIGYNRAARLMEELEERGYVSAEDGSKPRNVLITKSEYDEMYGEE